MKLGKFSALFRGLAAMMATLFALSTIGYSFAMSDIAISRVDELFGVDRNIYHDWTEMVEEQIIPGSFEGYTYLNGRQYQKRYSTVEQFLNAFVEHAKKQGEEGFALLRNEEKNGTKALPLDKSKEVVLFGWNAYNTPAGHTGVVAGNFIGTKMTTNWRGQPQEVTKNAFADNITLYSALNDMPGVKVNQTVKAEDFTGMMNAAPNYTEATIPEVFEAKSSWNIASDSTAIVVVGRGGGEGHNWKPDAATNAEDPLALSDDELAMIKYAKEHCAKVVLLVTSANAMELGPAVEKGGQYEVDAIGFCGIPNDFQYGGIAKVLAGDANATGALTDTYVYDNSFNPAVINMGEQDYSDADTIDSYPDPLGRGVTSYSGNKYVVQAEGIYVGYKYYETRYYDSIANPTYNAKASIGSTTGSAWDYSNEVIFTFGQGLSYTSYTQEVTNVVVDLSENGKVTVTVKVTNTGDKDDYFLAQLYVSRPYTDYDIQHNVEKSAIDFLNSKKVNVKKGESVEIQIEVPTHYLASWDSTALNGAGTYVLDAGDYYFTAAAGAHEAVNNILTAQGHTTDGTTNGTGAKVWTLEQFDDKTFSVSNGYEVRNRVQNADINYYLPGAVTYLTRNDWQGTFPKNYTNYVNGSGIKSEDPFTIGSSSKKDEWYLELINAQYNIKEDPNQDEAAWLKVVEGVLPAAVANGTFPTVWAYIMNVATTNPEHFSDIHSEEWQAVAAAINLNVAIGNVTGGGGNTDVWEGINNPYSRQSESVSGYQQQIPLPDGRTFDCNIGSNTLLGSSFNPELAYEWGILEGESGLWCQELVAGGQGQAFTVWGAGLNIHRSPYNGRNSEYMSEDPMLTNRIGAAQFVGLGEMGAICGPKHMGFNDQELNRVGNANYMTEQKVRETDTRCYEGALRAAEGNGTGVMMSFARIGATNVTNSVGYIKHIMREEWGFTGIITTDMGRAPAYHETAALIMATVNELASMSGHSYLGENGLDFDPDAKYSGAYEYLTLGKAGQDPVFAAQARQTSLYELYTIAHSSSGLYVQRIENTGDDIVVPAYTIDHHDPTGETIDRAGWENIFVGLEVTFGILAGLAGLAWIASVVGKEEN